MTLSPFSLLNKILAHLFMKSCHILFMKSLYDTECTHGPEFSIEELWWAQITAVKVLYQGAVIDGTYRSN